MSKLITKMSMLQNMSGLTQQGMADFFDVCGFSMCRSSISARARGTISDTFLDTDQYDQLISTLQETTSPEIIDIRDSIMAFYEFTCSIVHDITGADTSLLDLSKKVNKANEVLDDDSEEWLLNGASGEDESEDGDDFDDDLDVFDDDHINDDFDDLESEVDDDFDDLESEVDDDLDNVDDDFDDLDNVDNDFDDLDNVDDDFDDLDNVDDGDVLSEFDDDFGDLDDFLSGSTAEPSVDTDDLDCQALDHLVANTKGEVTTAHIDDFESGSFDDDEFDSDNARI